MAPSPAMWDAALEARAIYHAIFAGNIPPLVLERYLVASVRLDATFGAAELSDCRRAVTVCPDLEALEIAERYSRGPGLLSRKFRLMVYLAETQPENHSVFVNDRSSLLAGLLRSGLGFFRTLYKAARGLWLTQRLARE